VHVYVVRSATVYRNEKLFQFFFPTDFPETHAHHKSQKKPVLPVKWKIFEYSTTDLRSGTPKISSAKWKFYFLYFDFDCLFGETRSIPSSIRFPFFCSRLAGGVA
jgi:hypothetical protein